MIPIKTEEEIAKMREGGHILAETLEKVKMQVKPGISTRELDKFTDELISEVGEPSFKHVRDYKWATCMCVNEVVVHGIPNEYKLKEGDILGIDIGMLYKGFHTDMSETVIVGKGNEFLEKFLQAGKGALAQAIKAAIMGNRVGHISKAIGETITKAGFSPVQALIGHGVGEKLHEEPAIPCFLKGRIEETPLLKEGMVLAIEVIYNQGRPEVVYKNDDGWTIKTADGQLSGLFEQTVAILPKGPEILTLRYSSA